jgi:hypothetical protein
MKSANPSKQKALLKPPSAPARQFTPESIIRLGLGFWGSKTLLSAVELGLFTELSKKPLDAPTLALRLRLHARSARDFFDTLVSLGMLHRDGKLYSNTPETDYFLDRAKPSYIGGMLDMANRRLYPYWAELTEALRTGCPQNEIKKGEDLFSALYSDEEALRGFLQAMTGLSLGAAKVIAVRGPWRKYKTFVDIGGAQGGLAVQLALAHAHLKGGSFDLPAVGPIFQEYVASFALSERLRFYPGNFFEDPLPPADVYLMGHILHDWNLKEKLMLLSKAYKSLPAGGALIVFEAMIDDERRHNSFGLLMSLNMLIETTGGFDYTGADCCAWMREVGFSRTRVESLVGPDSMVIAVK